MDGTDGKGREAPPLIEYPLDYTFKVMGLAADDFPENARRLVAGVVGDGPVLRVSVRASAGGKYQSVSVSVRLSTEEERRGIYVALHADARVVYYL
jgi:putative lipoic acid-binding regulatory protein